MQIPPKHKRRRHLTHIANNKFTKDFKQILTNQKKKRTQKKLLVSRPEYTKRIKKKDIKIEPSRLHTTNKREQQTSKQNVESNLPSY